MLFCEDCLASQMFLLHSAKFLRNLIKSGFDRVYPRKPIPGFNEGRNEYLKQVAIMEQESTSRVWTGLPNRADDLKNL